jgi:hypothetical protein
MTLGRDSARDRARGKEGESAGDRNPAIEGRVQEWVVDFDDIATSGTCDLSLRSRKEPATTETARQTFRT